MRKPKDSPKLPIDKKARAYLAEIGRHGGLSSRRELSRVEARQMVAIREAKRAAVRAGKVELTRERWPLKLRPSKAPGRPLPQIQSRLIGPYRRGSF